MNKHDAIIKDFRRYAMADQAGWIDELIRHLQRQAALHQRWASRRHDALSAVTPRLWNGVAYEPGMNERRLWRAFYMRDGRPHTIARYARAVSAARSHDHVCWKLRHDLSLLNFPEEYTAKALAA